MAASEGNTVPLGTVRVLPIDSIRPCADNPRKVPPSAVDIVSKSISEFGWQQPIVVDVDNVIIVGHTRHLAAKKLKLKQVPVVIAEHLSPAQVRAYRIADNRSGDFTSWDFPALARQLDDLAEDFADVLALADWQSIVAEFDAMSAVPPAMPESRPPLSYEDNETDDFADEEEAVANYLSQEFQLVVACENEDAARKVAAQIIDIPGVTDVRDKR